MKLYGTLSGNIPFLSKTIRQKTGLCSPNLEPCSCRLPNSCRITNLFFYCLLQPFFPLFRCSHTGNRPHEDVARFGYRPGRTIIFLNYAAVWRPIRAGAINLANLVQKPCFLGDILLKKEYYDKMFTVYLYFSYFCGFSPILGEKNSNFYQKLKKFPFLVATLPKFTK